MDLVKQHWWRLLVALFAFYLIFGMQLGSRSFAGHVLRILKTPESRELGQEIVDKIVDVASGAKRRATLAFGPDR